MSGRFSAFRRQFGREGAWALADQVLSSGTNFVPSLILARVLGPSGFGTFSLAFLAWFLTLSVLRSAVMQPYTLAASGLEPRPWRATTAQSGGVVVAIGIALGLTFFLAGCVVGLGTPLGRSLGAIAALAPGLALQEFWRVASFASRRARTAFLVDAWWAAGQVVAFGLLLVLTDVTAAKSLVAWGAGAVVAAIAGCHHLRVVPSLRSHSFTAARDRLRISAWFLGTNTAFSVGLFGAAAIVEARAGAHDLGLFRMVQSNLFGPAQLITLAAESVFLPYLVRSVRSGRSARRQASAYSGIMTAAIVTYGLVLVAIGRPLLTHVFGDAFAPAARLIWPMLVVYALDAAGSGASLLLRATASGGRLFSVQLLATGTRLACVAVFTATSGVVGAVWGLAVGSATASGGWTWSARELKPRTQEGALTMHPEETTQTQHASRGDSLVQG